MKSQILGDEKDSKKYESFNENTSSRVGKNRSFRAFSRGKMKKKKVVSSFEIHRRKPSSSRHATSERSITSVDKTPRNKLVT